MPGRKRPRFAAAVAWGVALSSTTPAAAKTLDRGAVALPPRSSFDYFDVLWQHPDSIVQRAPPANNNQTSHSKILRVTPSPYSHPNNNALQEYRLASLKAFLPLTEGDTTLAGRSLDDAFALLLAVQHFNQFLEFFNNNQQDTSPVQNTPSGIGTLITGEDGRASLASCNVRLVADIVDSQMSSAAATFAYVNALAVEAGNTTTNNTTTVLPTTAVVGAYLSSVNAPLAILTGVTDTPQISWSATSLDLDDAEQYPVFGRTITTTAAEAAAAVQFFVTTLQSTHVVVLYVTDQFGASLRTSFAQAAARAGLTTLSIGVAVDATPTEWEQVGTQLAQARYRHVYVILFDTHLPLWADAAQTLGLVGPDYAYLLHGPDASEWQWRAQNTSTPLTPAVAQFLQGAGIVQPMGGLDNHDYNSLQATATPDRDEGYRQFAAAWREASQNVAFTEYVTSKLPASLQSVPLFDFSTATYTREPGAFRPFLYDAVVALGIAMCRAGESHAFFDGPDIFEQFRRLNTTGASGNLVIDSATGTRDASSANFVLWNVFNDTTTTAKEGFRFHPSVRLLGSEFIEIPGRDFRFANGGFVPPSSLPPLEEDFNYIGKTGRIIGYGMFGCTVLAALLSLAWLCHNRTSRVVYAAQPLFLGLVAIGSIVSASSLIPLGVEETTVSSTDGLDFACMVTPWLYVIGSNITLSALLSKTRKVYQAYLDPSMEYIQVRFSDILKVLLVLLFISGIVLTTWTIIAPLEWTRTYRSNTDVFLRLTDSYGECHSDSSAFGPILVTVNFCYLCLGSWQATVTRHVETEYKESLYINVALFAILQAWTMGTAIMLVTDDDARARFYVLSGIVFVTSLSSLALIFLPKVFALREDIRTKGRRAYLRRHRSGKLVALPDERRVDNDASSFGGAMDNEDAEETSRASGDGEYVNEGSKVVHNPKTSANLLASGGHSFSRAQMHEYVRTQSGEFDLGSYDGARSMNQGSSDMELRFGDGPEDYVEPSPSQDIVDGDTDGDVFADRLPVFIEEDSEGSVGQNEGSHECLGPQEKDVFDNNGSKRDIAEEDTSGDIPDGPILEQSTYSAGKKNEEIGAVAENE